MPFHIHALIDFQCATATAVQLCLLLHYQKGHCHWMLLFRSVSLAVSGPQQRGETPKPKAPRPHCHLSSALHPPKMRALHSQKVIKHTAVLALCITPTPRDGEETCQTSAWLGAFLLFICAATLLHAVSPLYPHKHQPATLLLTSPTSTLMTAVLSS